MRGYCRIQREEETANRSKVIRLIFHVGPLRFCVISNVPQKGSNSAPAYVELTFHPDERNWRDPSLPEEEESQKKTAVG